MAAKLAELRDRMADLERMITILEDVQSCGCVAIADCDRANALTSPEAEA